MALGAFIEAAARHAISSARNAVLALRRARRSRVSLTLFSDPTESVRRLFAAQEEERRHLARELHDQLAQHVAALMWELDALQNREGADRNTYARARHIASELDRDLHRVTRGLRPAALDEFGLRVALRDHLVDWAQRTGIAADFASSGIDERLPYALELAVYRIAQEALTNVGRHAAARRVSVVLRQTGAQLVVLVEDDGGGFAAETNAVAEVEQLGLRGMRERAALVQGTVAIESAVGAGTCVIVTVPLQPLRLNESEAVV